MQLQEQQALQNRAKQELEAEAERYKQVRWINAAMAELQTRSWIYVSFPMTSCKSQELQYMEEENHRAKNTLQSRIKDREDEIQKLRNQVSSSLIVQYIRVV